MKIIQLLLFSLTLILPAWVLWELTSILDYRLVIGYPVLISLLGYVACFRDKKKASNNEWRTPEKALHLIELAGGWLGSFGAQRFHRHKTSKLSYQITFWLIVLLYQIVAIEYLRDWPLVTRALEAIRA